MKIERSNILELIGTGKNKYHSCVITSYSIDLAFFEQLILPRLRAAGVTNINVLVDASMLEKYLTSHIADSTKKVKINYSITPVHLSGAFHPKMLFLAGKNKGYLSIGSGNITSSGLLYNDEVWSSFYTDKERVSAHAIFKSAWQYIQSLSKHCLGINLIKINWISQHSEWIKELKNSNSTAVLKAVTYKLSHTKKDTSLYKDVIQILPKKPNSIKIVAPYYNTSGAFLQKLIDDLSPSEMHCVVDKTSGILPVGFKSNFCQFSDWRDVIKSENSKSIQRLHAKMIQIEYDDETFFILGSANATIEAYGISNRNIKNDEAVITIKTEKPRNFLKELGIKVPKKGTLDIRKTKNNELKNSETPKRLLKLKQVTLSDQSLKITLGKKDINSFLLRTFDSKNELLEELEVSPDAKVIQTLITKTEGIFKVALFDLKKHERVSTFGLIQNINVLKKSNPDERLARLQSFEHLDIFNSLNYELVLDFLAKEQVFSKNRTSQSPTLVKSEIEEDKGQVISESEYNKNAGLTLDEKVTSENIASMVEEFLDVLKIRESQEELSSNSEAMALEAGDDGMDEDTTLQHIQKSISSKEGQRISRKVKKTVTDVTKLIHDRSINEIPHDSKTFSALFIGFHVLLHFWDEVYTQELSVVTVYYEKLKHLSKLEKEFGLKRLESQVNSSVKNEVSYYIDFSLFNTFKSFVESSDKGFKIIGNPSVPIALEHPIIPNKYIQNYSSDNWLLDFLDLGLSQVIIELKSSELNIDASQKVKLLILSNQLINKTVWDRKFNHWRKLILLNIYEKIGLHTLKLNENDVLRKLTDDELFRQYLTFKQNLEEGVIRNTEVNSQLANSIVYSIDMGFGMVRRTLKDAKLEFYSPLITNNIESDEGGVYKEVYIAKQVKVFNF